MCVLRYLYILIDSYQCFVDRESGYRFVYIILSCTWEHNKIVIVKI